MASRSWLAIPTACPKRNIGGLLADQHARPLGAPAFLLRRDQAGGRGRAAASQQQFGGMMLTEPVGIVPPMPAAASSASSGSSGIRICASAWSSSWVSSFMATILFLRVAHHKGCQHAFQNCLLDQDYARLLRQGTAVRRSRLIRSLVVAANESDRGTAGSAPASSTPCSL